MRFSRALLAGAALVPQSREVFFEWEGKRLVAACATGTTCIGAGMRVPPGEVIPDLEQLDRVLGGVLDNMTAHPVSGRVAQLNLVVQSLNDKHKWSREKIAAWLQTLGY